MCREVREPVSGRGRERGFFEVAWTMFRAAMKGVFTGVSILYVCCIAAMVLFSGSLFRMGFSEMIVGLGATLVMGLFAVGYVTLLLAVPISFLCALVALVVTVLGHVSAGLSGVASSGLHPFRGTPASPAPDPRIQFVEAKVDKSAAVCPVCAVAISGESVRCSRCDSHHHLECWEYNGSCATFGCGSVESIASDGQAPPEAGREWWPIDPSSSLPKIH